MRLREDDLVIKTSGLKKSFKKVNVLQGLDLEVRRNSIFGFLGPNGAGKTTTIKLLLGLARPTDGSATLFGFDSQRDTLEVRRRIGYLAQDPRFYDYMTARETLRFTARFFFQPAGLERHIDETLELVGLADKADRPIRGFSGGERQRLGIAQAQISKPELLILDEPAASLDPMGRRDVLEVMGRLREHTTIFYSTHILEDVQRISDTAAILHHGQLLAHASMGELLSDQTGGTYLIDLVGDTAATRRTVAGLSWVTSLEETTGPDGTHWQVSTDDTSAAELLLLRTILADDAIRVRSFGRRRHRLEDVFVTMIEGGAV
ncbi:MAG: ABC transporter ATP-binding protein [Gemmatimonadales bacterium]|nr:ABC transporter ATP-binding protein [Gemmatimonadales bacterium]